jgi:hypothetical protein
MNILMVEVSVTNFNRKQVFSYRTLKIN